MLKTLLIPNTPIIDTADLPEMPVARGEEASESDSSVLPRSDREPLRMLVIGSRTGVTGTIQTLHRLGYAQIGEWSPLMPGPNPGEVMAILTRYFMRS